MMEPTPMISISLETIYYSRVYAGVISPLILLSLSMVIARLYTRRKSPVRLRADDWIIAAAFVGNIPSPQSNIPIRTRVLTLFPRLLQPPIGS